MTAALGDAALGDAALDNAALGDAALGDAALRADGGRPTGFLADDGASVLMAFQCCNTACEQFFEEAYST